MNVKSIGIVVTLVLTMFMAAIESSIISLAMPTIRRDLHAGPEISLVFTVYFIALVVANPIVGELLTRFKILYIAMVGLLLFGIGSLMSGMSGTFYMLIVSRAIQGIGAGVMMSLTQIVPKLAFEIPFRYKIMGIVGSVWGISSIIGPLLGGGILEFATWHWLFFINIPIAIIAIILAFLTFHFSEETEVQAGLFDVKGLSLFYIFIGLLMFSILNKSMLTLNLVAFILAIIVAVMLFKFENKTAHPFIPIAEFNRSVSLVFITDLLTAVCLMGYNLYIPVYLQDHLNLSPLQSGLVIFPLSVAWLTLNFNLARIEAKLSRKALYIGAFTLLLVSSLILIFGSNAPLLIAATVILAGLSFGFVYTKDSVIVQEETSSNHMKKMMSFYALTKNLGSSIGSTIMGYLYAMSTGLLDGNLHNILGAVSVVSIILIIIWTTLYKNNTQSAQ
ncbi:multidrug transporter [Staphylococcus petrasii]|uniref:MFS transporter n=1 Tax=Staphylococcus petrasii TaxID=1276936 RepID=A0A380FYD1_9STAP|nr:multidrug efflux MFS transporter SdrM [Staphylococcus petrasii]PNZ30703.1 MFS transporter [Staphylococcus petrasii]TGE11922.1 MFS transporter [Staphylococcus petrasii]TGE19013.1 MFS transporter [Staphylococcus petrasii]SUM43307.1 multidrug transporter [Staphylococcus petrasii]